MRSNRTPASVIAFGGVLAALAVVIMSMGTLIPVATYACPVLCALCLELVRKICGSRIAWAWYGAVAILSLLLSPDKEAAGVFLFLGYYPIVKPKLDRHKGKWIWKFLFFNASVLVLYWLMLHILGFQQLVQEYSQMGAAMISMLLVLGNVTFFLLDRLLEMKPKRKR